MNEERYGHLPPNPAESSRYENGPLPHPRPRPQTGPAPWAAGLPVSDAGRFPAAGWPQGAEAGRVADPHPHPHPIIRSAPGVEAGRAATGGPVGSAPSVDTVRFAALLPGPLPGAEAGPVSAREAGGGRFSAVDGLRGVAVLAVLLHDTGVSGRYVSWSGAGVDVLLVLTGFLATLPLVRRATATGRTGVVGFLARRAKRLVPALLVAVALTVSVCWALGSARTVGDLAGPMGHGGWAEWVHCLRLGVVPTLDRPLAPLWLWVVTAFPVSVWALLLACLGLLARHRLAAVALVVSLLAGAVAVASASGALPGVDVVTGTRVLALAAGAGAACLVHLAERGGRAVTRRVGVLQAVAGVAAAAVVAVSAVRLGGGEGGARYVVAVVLGAALLTAVLCGGRGPLARLLSGDLLTEVGRMSYSLFLLHLPVYWLLRRGQPGLGALGLFLVGGVVTWFLSLLVHYLLVERLAARSWRRGRVSH
ncbi:acyltransferase family protein [Streptomyces sp. NBC_00459]|uniref:acyltransferase family protein n=1 Tax=Streptomyces sp. NBC_00459 TaxID=2975749 RepID=UPI002E19B3BF